MKTRLHADRHAPRAARAFVVRQLTKEQAADSAMIDDVVLVASELVTNSVRAGATRVEIDVRTRAGQLDLVVEDDADGWPEPMDVDDESTTGRGLQIVAQVADRWKVDRRRRGKRVVASWSTR